MKSDGLKVLVIDDETATLTMFRLFLKTYGYDVMVAADGRSGLEIVRCEAPAIVFTDLKMPEIDGFEVLREIKKTAPRTEVIVITGHGDMDLAIQALNLDATDFINKPIRRTALDAALQRAEDRLQRPMPNAGAIAFSQEADIGVIAITGTLRRENREAISAACSAARQAAPSGVLVRFTDHAAFDGSGIAELTNCLSAIRKNGQPVAVSGLSENFKVISEMVGLTRFAGLFDTEAAARAALTGQ